MMDCKQGCLVWVRWAVAQDWLELDQSKSLLISVNCIAHYKLLSTALALCHIVSRTEDTQL